MTTKPMNPLILTNFIDSCAFDPKYKPETEASNKLYELYKSGLFLLNIANSTLYEIDHPNTPPLVKQAASSMISSMRVPLTDSERKTLAKIEEILTGNGRRETILQDAMHVFEAQKYGHYFITTDMRILSHAAQLSSTCGVDIKKPSEFLSIVMQYAGGR